MKCGSVYGSVEEMQFTNALQFCVYTLNADDYTEFPHFEECCSICSTTFV